jgi:hypothetical protein
MESIVDDAQEVSNAQAMKLRRREEELMMLDLADFEPLAVPSSNPMFEAGRILSTVPPVLDPIDTALQAPEPRGNYLSYPVSRLAAKIVPQDLTNFKSRGVSRVERELQQEMLEIQERYMEVIDAFNWNKLIYEAHFGFEPVVGEVYHLYEVGNRCHLSMIEPEKWHQRWIGSFRLNADGRWQVEKTAKDFDIRNWVSTRVG